MFCKRLHSLRRDCFFFSVPENQQLDLHLVRDCAGKHHIFIPESKLKTVLDYVDLKDFFFRS